MMNTRKWIIVLVLMAALLGAAFWLGLIQEACYSIGDMLTDAAHDYRYVRGAMQVDGLEDIEGFSEGLAPACKDGKWGYVDRLGEFVLGPKWDWAYGFVDGTARVSLDGETQYIDKKGNVLLTGRFMDSGNLVDGFTWGLDSMSFEYRIVGKNGSVAVIDCDDIDGDFSDGLLRFEKDGRYGFADTKGNAVVEPKYDDALPFSNGLAAVEKKGRWGYIDRKGRMAIPAKYSEATSFSDGIALVCDGVTGEWIGINRFGYKRFDVQWKINPRILGDPQDLAEFIEAVNTWTDIINQPVTADGFAGGLAQIRTLNGEAGFIDRTGDLVVLPYPDYTKYSRNAGLRWDMAGAFAGGIANTDRGLINEAGEMIYYTLGETSGFSDGLAVMESKGDCYILYSDEVADAVVGDLVRLKRYDLLSSFAVNGLKLSPRELAETEASCTYYRDIASILEKHGDMYSAAVLYRLMHAYQESFDAYAACIDAFLAEGKAAQARGMIADAAYVASLCSEDISGKAEAYEARISYAEASALMQAGDYLAAAEAFAALGQYQDAQERLKEAYYCHAEQLKLGGHMEEAMRMMIKAEDYADAASQVESYYLRDVTPLLERGEYRKASLMLAKIGIPEYLKEAYRIRSMYLMDDRISVNQYDGNSMTVIAADGTIHTNKENISSLKGHITSRKDVVCIKQNDMGMVALCGDGTVLTDNFVQQTNEWTDIVTLAAGKNHVLGLRADGTVVAAGRNRAGQLDVGLWTDIIAIEATESASYGLRRDGTLVVAGQGAAVSAANGWTGITDISAVYDIVALREDGTVLYADQNETRVLECPDNVVDVGMGYGVFALLDDGAVVRLGGSVQQQYETKGYRDITAVCGKNIVIDRMGNMYPESASEGFVFNKNEKLDRLVPPAMLATESSVWIPEAEMLIQSGAYSRAMDLLVNRLEDSEALRLYQQAAYAQAEEMAGQGKTDEAIALYLGLGDYQDAQERCLGIYYQEGMTAVSLGETDRAIAWFEKAGDYKDAAQQLADLAQQMDSEIHAQIEALRAEGREREAMYLMRRLGGTRFLQESYAGLNALDRMKAENAAYEEGATWTLAEDGSVRGERAVMEKNPGMGDRSGFAACAGTHRWAAGITPEGDVYMKFGSSPWNLKWTGMVAVSGSLYNMIGLKADGTVEVSWWENLGQYYDVTPEDLDLSSWTDIVDVAMGDTYAVGLKEDGTVVAKGILNASADVDDWTDVVDICVGRVGTVGLRSDGTLLAAGAMRAEDKKALESLTDVVEVYALTSSSKVVAVKRNGKRVVIGD